MARKAIKSALSDSLKAEDEAVRSRFEKAESLLGGKQSRDDDSASSESEKKLEQRKRVVRDSFTLPSEDYELIAEIFKPRYIKHPLGMVDIFRAIVISE